MCTKWKFQANYATHLWENPKSNVISVVWGPTAKKVYKINMVHKIFYSECPSWKKVSRKILQPYTMTNFYNYLNTPYSLSLNTNFASKLQTIDITECQQTNKIYSSNIRKFPKYSTWFAIKALRPVCLHVCMLFKLVCFVREKRKINDGIFYNDRLLKYRYES